MTPFVSRMQALIFAAGIACAGWTTAAVAASFEEIDGDGNGIITEAEMDEYFGPKLGGAALHKYDINGDGEVTVNEVEQASNEEGFTHSTEGMARAWANQQAAAERAAAGQARAAAHQETAQTGGGGQGQGRGRPGS